MHEQKPPAENRPPPLEIDLRSILHVFRRNLWLILLCLLLAVGAGVAYYLRAPKLFVSEMVVQVESGSPNVLKIADVSPEALETIETLNTIEKTLAGRGLIARVLADPGLGLTPAQLGLPPRPAKPYSQNELTEALKGAVTANVVRGTRLINVTVQNESPDLAQKIATALIETYRRWIDTGRGDLVGEANRFLIEEADRLKTKLRESEQHLQDYKQNVKAVSLDSRQDIVTATLKDLSSRLTQARGERLALETAHNQLTELGKGEPDALLGVAAINSDPTVLDQKKRLGEVEVMFAQLQETLLSRHPHYIQAERAVQEVRDSLRRAIVNARDSIDTRYDAAVQTEKKLADAVAAQESSALQLNNSAIGYSLLAREVEANRTMLDSVLARINETGLTRGLPHDAIRLVQPPTLPDRPAKPRKRIVFGGALAVGLFLGVALTLIRHMLDHSLRTVDAAERWLGLPVIAMVPRGGRFGAARRLHLVQLPESPGAEAIRTLRTSLTLAAPPSESQSVLFTSALEGEGKSFCASNCAVAFAQLGLPTLIVDADLRVPMIGKIFGDKNGAHPGVAEVLAGKSFIEAARSTAIPNLSILTAGQGLGNPAELLSGTGFAQLMEEARKHFRRVVIDSAPVHAASDTLLLVQHVQAVCLVVNSRTTPREAALRAIHVLQEAGARMAGIVLNRLPVRSGKSCYYHYGTGPYGDSAYHEAKAAPEQSA